MATIDDILGSPDFLRQLIGEEQFAKSRGQALNQGILQASLAALGGRGNTGQILAQAGQAGLQGFQGAMDKTLSDMLKSTQISEMVRKQKEAAQLKQLLASAAKPEYTFGAGEEGPTRELTGMTYDLKSVVPALQASGRFDLIKDIGESQKTLRQSGIMTGGEQAPSPFAPYLQATSPQVRQLAQQLQTGFERGIIDEETAFKRIEPLAKMEEAYVGRVDKAAEGKKPTEAQYKAATLAGRLEGSLQDLKKIGGEDAKALTPEVIPSLLQDSFLSYLPGTGMIAGKLSSENRLRAEAAQLDALDAALTLGTGAAYTREQLKGYAKSYFPQVGDGEKAIQEKTDRFSRLVELAKLQAGPAAANIAEARRLSAPFNIDKLVEDNGLEPRPKR